MKDNQQKDSQYLKPAFESAAKEIQSLVVNGVGSREERDHLRAIISVLSAYPRLKMVEISENSLKFQVSRAMAEDTKELKKHIQKSLPEYVEK